MESPSGRRRLGAPRPSGAGRNCRPRPCQGGDGGGVDSISGLSDDLLIQVLVRLRCAGAAIRTGVLSRRWRGIWRHLPELSFRGIAYGALKAALEQIALPKLLRLDIEIPGCVSAQAVASLLRIAARHLEPVEFSIKLYSENPIGVQMPCFARARSIRINVKQLYLTPPAQGGGFPVLERLSIANCRFDAGALISRCPRLRVLELNCCRLVDTITVHSATVEELVIVTGERRRLCLKTHGHAYGALMLKLLRICSAVQRLKLVDELDTHIIEACPPSCPCDQPSNWRSQNISLTGLEEVEIENFKGSGHEVDLLKLLFRCAPLTKVTVRLVSNVVARSRGCKEACNIFKANPAVECHVYRKHGKEVIYA